MTEADGALDQATTSEMPHAGRMTWEQAVAGPLRGTTCLWQDLDGLHVEPAPAGPPPTSLLWGWHATGYLIRVRLDGDTAFVAVLDQTTVPPTQQHVHAGRTLPWAPGDDRIAASAGRGPGADLGGAGAAYEQIIADGISDGTGPITFVRPAQPADGTQDA